MYAPEHTAAWKRIVDFVHASSDAKIALQLGHAGAKGSTRVMWEGIDLPLEEANWPLVSASEQQYLPGVSQTARAATEEEIAHGHVHGAHGHHHGDDEDEGEDGDHFRSHPVH